MSNPLPPLPNPFGLFNGLPNFPFEGKLSYIGDELKLIGQGPIASLIEVFSDKNGMGNLVKVGQFLINETGRFNVPMSLGGPSAREIQIVSGPITKSFIVNPKVNSITEKRAPVEGPQAGLPFDSSPSQAVLDARANQPENGVQFKYRQEQEFQNYQEGKPKGPVKPSETALV